MLENPMLFLKWVIFVVKYTKMALTEKYINPLTDFGFKKIFGTEPNKDLLIDFLNELLPKKKKIKNLTYTQNEHLGNSAVDRKAIFDLYCESEQGEKFIVEMQKAKQNYFKDRSVYYSTFPVQEQAKRGDWNYHLKDVFTIGILDFVFDDSKDEKFISTVKLKDQDCKVFYEKLTFIYIELPKFKKDETLLTSKFDKWIYVLKHLSRLENRPTALREKIFKKLFESAEIAKFTKKEQQAYEQSLKYYRDIKNVVDTSRQEGIEVGMEVGIEVGIEKGIEKGRQEGREERDIEIVKTALKGGFSIESIIKLTGLSKEDILKIKQDETL